MSLKVKNWIGQTNNFKFQITNNKPYPMTKITNSKHSAIIECAHWSVSVIGISNWLFTCPVKQIEDLMPSIV
jgi:hypothetical protein